MAAGNFVEFPSTKVEFLDASVDVMFVNLVKLVEAVTFVTVVELRDPAAALRVEL